MPSVTDNTYADFLAALYGEAGDPAFEQRNRFVPTVKHLEEAYSDALRLGFLEAAEAFEEEVRRAHQLPPAGTTQGLLVGSAAGLWRVH